MRAQYLYGVVSALVIGVGACSQAVPSSATKPSSATPHCVDIPDVDFFTIVDGKFTPASATTVDLPAPAIPALVRGLGFDWMRADQNWNAVSIRGEAPNTEAKRLGFTAAEAAIMAHPHFIAGAIASINDRINVASGDAAALQARMTEAFDGLGCSWMSLSVKGQVATLIGTAPTAEEKEVAYDAGRAEIEGDELARQMINVVVDGLSINGGAEAVGAVVTALPSEPRMGQCQSAFAAVMDGRNVEFALNQAAISPLSARLLDAAAGVALICSEYAIEVGGHTDARGSDNYNLTLSQERADSVRLYLIDKGVSAQNVTAVGYGETRPLDAAMTNQAYEKNRRTAFIVQTQ